MGIVRAEEISISVGDVLQKLKVVRVSWKYPTGSSFFRSSDLLNYEIIKANVCFTRHALEFYHRFHCRGIGHSTSRFRFQSNIWFLFLGTIATQLAILAYTNSYELFCIEANRQVDIQLRSGKRFYIFEGINCHAITSL